MVSFHFIRHSSLPPVTTVPLEFPYLSITYLYSVACLLDAVIWWWGSELQAEKGEREEADQRTRQQSVSQRLAANVEN